MQQALTEQVMEEEALEQEKAALFGHEEQQGGRFHFGDAGDLGR